MIAFDCLTCSTRYKVPADRGGLKTRCKQCGEALVVPRRGAAPAKQLVAEPEPAGPSCASCGSDQMWPKTVPAPGGRPGEPRFIDTLACAQCGNTLQAPTAGPPVSNELRPVGPPPALAEGEPVPVRSPEVAPEPCPDRRASGRLAALLPVGLLLLCGALYAAAAVFGGRGEPLSASGTPSPLASFKPPPSDEERVREPVVRWLEDMKRGGRESPWREVPSTRAGAPTYGNRPYLYSVRSYDILSVEVKPATETTFREDGLKRLGIVVVRVEASDRDGHPTVKTYRVRVGDDGSATFLLGAL